MSTYNFDQLSSDEFELLVRDLLAEELGLTLEVFARGRDAGIDLRGYVPNGELIGQCKHYVRTGLAGLIAKLKKEVPKIQARTPARYIVATSVPLTPNNKDEIVDIFKPYIHSTADVLGQEAINDLLSRFPEIEKRHFKLWLTSVPVLQRVLLSGVYEQSETLKETLATRMRLYVVNASFARAQRTLRDHRVCIIAGIPGIGKTMLADMLLVSHIADGYCPVVVSHDIKEANDLFKVGVKQVFYYDDFLGQAGSAEKELNKNEDARLSAFIDRVARHKDKRFIMTTREYILSDVKQRFEKLAEVDNLTKCIVDIGDYGRVDRAKVLYNHLYFSTENEELRRAVVLDKSYFQIIDHKNYNPRLVEKVIQLSERGNVMPRQFVEFFVETLNRPARLWKHSVDNLPDHGRSMLLALASMAQVVRLDELEVAFGQFVDSGPIVDSRRWLNMLEGTFIRIDAHGPERSVQFHNPSVYDYLLLVLNSEQLTVLRLLQRASFFEQPRTLFRLAQERTTKEGTEFRHGGLRASVSKHRDELIASLLRTLSAPSAQFSLSYEAAGTRRVSRLTRSFDSRERRLSVVCEAAAAFGTGKNDGPLREALRTTASDWDQNAGNKVAIAELLKACSVIPSLRDLLEDLLRSAKAFVRRGVRASGDVERILEIGDFVGAELSVSELNELRAEFQAIVATEVDTLIDDEDDPDNISSAMSNLEELALSLDVDIEEKLDALRERMDELEASRDAEEDAYEDRDVDSGRFAARETDRENAEIDRLFETLVPDKGESST